MKIRYLSLFTHLLEPYFEDSFIKKALKQNALSVEFIKLRDFSDNKYKSVDDSPYGGSDGMLLRADIASQVFSHVASLDRESSELSEQSQLQQNKLEKTKKINVYMSPQGQPLDQPLVQKLVTDYNEINILCGRYGGIDQRIIDQYIDLEISIGDYVLSGGELPALVLTEALVRYLPGVVGDAQSVVNDSFTEGFLEAPQYTKPEDFHGAKVPAVLRSGNHKEIELYKLHSSLLITYLKRVDLFEKNFVEYIKKQLTQNSLKCDKFKNLHLEFLETEGLNLISNSKNCYHDIHEIKENYIKIFLNKINLVMQSLKEQKV